MRRVRRRKTAMPRQSAGADRDAENSEGQLHQSKGNIEPADRTVAETCGKSTVDEDVHLHGTGRDYRRSHQREHGTHAFVAPSKIGAILVADAVQRRELCDQLPGAADERANCQASERTRAEMRIEP